jgi:polar amino acid transport system permease protein
MSGLLAYQFDWSIIPPILTLLLRGLALTLEITVVTIVVSMIVAVPLALARMSLVTVIRWPAQLYIEVFRGTPLLVQLIWVYYALPAVLGISLQPFIAVVIALSANLTAFMAEAYRAGFQAVPREHLEAGQVLGLPRRDIVRFITVPQALRQQIPVILSLNISLFKDSSLVSTLGVADLTYQGNIESSLLFRPMEIYTTVAAIYFLIAFPATLITSYIERRMMRAQEGHGPRGTRGSRNLVMKLLPTTLIFGGFSG